MSRERREERGLTANNTYTIVVLIRLEVCFNMRRGFTLIELLVVIAIM